MQINPPKAVLTPIKVDQSELTPSIRCNMLSPWAAYARPGNSMIRLSIPGDGHIGPDRPSQFLGSTRQISPTRLERQRVCASCPVRKRPSRPQLASGHNATTEEDACLTTSVIDYRLAGSATEGNRPDLAHTAILIGTSVAPSLLAALPGCCIGPVEQSVPIRC